jgi:ABC-type transporter MlaC component
VTTQLLRLNNRFGMRLFGIVLSAVMLFVVLAAQPARAEQRPDTILHETVEQLLAELDSNRSALAADKCQLYSLVNRLVLPKQQIT